MGAFILFVREPGEAAFFYLLVPPSRLLSSRVVIGTNGVRMSRVTTKVSIAAVLAFTALTASGCTPVFSLFSF
ncbi:hypothetical protein [Mycobacterium shigaense]|uniref:hypothetical protein n=1 Tax=Mycobacterium shigaense TaxID=722731 RepID=UPI000BBA8460|nr:hypothetical protein [Mycobacterium shigaense]MEA1124473.1 hypothetical protein [Mycobacterium shigaense]